MKKTMETIAHIQMGYHFRRRLEKAEQGNVKVIQMRDLQEDNTIDFDSLKKIYLQEIPAQHLAKKGDLLFRSRGNVPMAALVNKDLENTIVGSHLSQISVTQTDLVLPAYLCWFINHRKTQDFLQSRSKGSVIQMLPLREFKSLEIEIPDMATQEKITEIFFLAAKESQITKELQKKKTLLIQEKLMLWAKGEIHETELV